MPSAVAIVKASTDRFVPKVHQGTLPPNYYCRGWNSRRLKYCRARAGAGTDHPGVGRCKNHAGSSPVKHGFYRSIDAPRIRELMDQFEQHPDPLNVLEDLNLVRALTRDYVERASNGQTSRVPEARLLLDTLDEYEITLRDDDAEPTEAQLEQLEKAREAIAALTAERALPDVGEAVKFVDVISKMIHRVEMLRTAGAVSLDQVRRFLAAVDRELQLYVTDEPLRDKLRKAFYSIRV